MRPWPIMNSSRLLRAADRRVHGAGPRHRGEIPRDLMVPFTATAQSAAAAQERISLLYRRRHDSCVYGSTMARSATRIAGPHRAFSRSSSAPRNRCSAASTRYSRHRSTWTLSSLKGRCAANTSVDLPRRPLAATGRGTPAVRDGPGHAGIRGAWRFYGKLTTTMSRAPEGRSSTGELLFHAYRPQARSLRYGFGIG